jgi:hypothetical protein
MMKTVQFVEFRNEFSTTPEDANQPQSTMMPIGTLSSFHKISSRQITLHWINILRTIAPLKLIQQLKEIIESLFIDGGLTDLINRGCAKLKNFRHREDVRKVVQRIENWEWRIWKCWSEGQTQPAEA